MKETVREIKKSRIDVDSKYRSEIFRLNSEYRKKEGLLIKKYKDRWLSCFNENIEKDIPDKYYQKNKNVIDSYSHISIVPLKILLCREKFDYSDFCLKTDVRLGGIINSILKTYPEDVPYECYKLRTQDVCSIARYFNVPLSCVVGFTGYEVKPEYSRRFGITETYSGKKSDDETGISYEPLRRLLVEKIKLSENKSINKFVDCFNDNSDSNYNRRLKSNIKNDRFLTLPLLYNICRELNCTIDFVAEWI